MSLALITVASQLQALSKADLTELQTKLAVLGYYKAKVDGIFGKHTGEAWARFKVDHYQSDLTKIGPGSIKILLQQSQGLGKIDWSDFNAKVSDYFIVGEATNWDKKRIPTDPTIQANIIRLAKHLDQVRADWGSAIAVTSWYRPPAINRAVGGVSNSQHLSGLAADIYPVTGDLNLFQRWLDNRWAFALGYGAPLGFVHVDLRSGRLRWNY